MSVNTEIQTEKTSDEIQKETQPELNKTNRKNWIKHRIKDFFTNKENKLKISIACFMLGIIYLFFSTKVNDRQAIPKKIKLSITIISSVWFVLGLYLFPYLAKKTKNIVTSLKPIFALFSIALAVVSIAEIFAMPNIGIFLLLFSCFFMFLGITTSIFWFYDIFKTIKNYIEIKNIKFPNITKVIITSGSVIAALTTIWSFINLLRSAINQ